MAGISKGQASRFIVDDLLASTTAVKFTPAGGVIIDSSARDNGHLDGATHLRRGLLLGRIDATGRFKEYDPQASDGSEVAENAVVLAQEVRDIDEAPKEVSCIWAGMLRKAAVVVSAEARTINIAFSAQSANCTVGDTITFSGGATGELLAQTDDGATGTMTILLASDDVPAPAETLSNGSTGDGTVDSVAFATADELVDWSKVQRLERY